MPVLFCDIGGTVADARLEADGSLTLLPRPRVMAVLNSLDEVPKGIISNPGTQEGAAAAAAAALHEAFPGRFTDAGLVHWGPKNSRRLFDEAIASAASVEGEGARAVVPDECVFVGEDPQERAFAREAGMRTAAHPVFALAAVENRPVFWTRIELSEGRELSDLAVIANEAEVVPVHVASERLVLAMASTSGAGALQQAGFTVDLRGRVEDTAAFLIRDNRPLPAVEAFADVPSASRSVVEAALRATAVFGFVADELAATPAPPVTSLGPAPGGVYLAAPAGAPVEEVHLPGAKPGHTERLLPDPVLLARRAEAPPERLIAGVGDGLPSPETIAAVRAAVTPEVLRRHVASISGVEPLVEGAPLKVRSRDASTEDNALVVEALARRFEDLGLTVRLHPFRWRDHRLLNVEAEHRVPGADSTVLITAHMDSTAANGVFFRRDGELRPYDPAIDSAPGADDDGSGTAAVMAAAECLRTLLENGRAPTRNVRFVLFNAEEQGLVGSKFYARAAAAAGDRIAGVFQMDMIAGRQQGSTPVVEIHAGSSVPGPVVSASDALGGRVARTVPVIDPEVTVQQLTGPADPAVGRSDHASFHERGWAAVAISEDLFSTPDGDPGTGTRQYHTPGDTLLDQDHNTEFAATVARSVTATAFTFAGL
ncbi:M20/M25/M40 family metallo-hydrolase [Streptomyces sp. P9(2023)]|uniref:M20/M25/M40 family metallo-hydrolase n=1 Tax=Streptomyces sp. P9(2023) TaxID=3064394 RepID=UPI0028F40462|nr:M20/M25/M40 family metallo-hydrolase [Streptomyces sp. P9(2023)]MDT9686936.1 M20/M25/M40 family metallo-hydrolase [Streptomyces sp. P9(2023)]